MDDLAGPTAVLSSWEVIGPIVRNGRTWVSAGRHFQNLAFEPAIERDVAAARGAAPEPGTHDFRPDAMTAAIAIDVVRELAPEMLFVSFGEPDEYAHRGDRERYLGSLRAADRFLGWLDDVLVERGRAATTTVIVTADHGRSTGFRDHGAAWPESKRSFLVASGAGIRARGNVTTASVRYLRNVAPTVRVLLGAKASATEEPIDELLLP